MSEILSDIEKVLTVIDSIESQKDPKKLFDLLSEYFKIIGFEHTSIAQILNPAMAKKNLEYYGESNFPDEWQRNWLESGYVFHDPIVRFSLRTRSIFDWEEARNSADKIGQKVHDSSRDYGLTQGIAIPVFIGNRAPGVISLSHKGLHITEREKTLIELVCIHAYSQFSKINDTEEFEPARLSTTAREREILHYIAAGKTAEQVGKILFISETTVVKHLSNLSLKLETNNRIHTVTKCLRTGLILP